MGLESIVIDALSGLDPFWVMIALAALPVGECRASIVYGLAEGLDPAVVFFGSFFANITAIPIIFTFLNLKPVMRLINYVMGERLEKKIEQNKAKFEKYEELALFGFVAIPMIGTGAWTGSLLAHTLKLDHKKSFFVISAGVLAAAIMVYIGTMGVITALSFL